MLEGNSTAPVRGVGYYRKSNEDDGSSVEQQQHWAREACAREGIDLVREFTDQAKKGHENATRTDFHEMLRFCQAQAKRGEPVDVIVTWHQNRFSRSDSHETSWYVWELRKAGVSRMFTANKGWVDFARMEDRILLNIEQDATSHQYVINLAQDSTRGRLAGAEAGRWMGGPVPYGYRPEMEKVTVKGRTRYRTKRLVLGPDQEAAVVRRLFRDYAAGKAGLRGLAQRLTAEGVPAPEGGAAWGTNTVKRILRNPAYLGRLAWGRRTEGKFFGVVDAKLVKKAGRKRREDNPAAAWVWSAEQTHEPLTDLATWELCQALLARRKKEGQPRLGCYPLSGLVRCGHCGGHMVARVNRVQRRNGQTHQYRRVLCGTYNRTGGPSCNYNAVDADALARAVVRKLRERLFNREALETLRAEVRRQDKEALGGADLASLTARLAAAERRLDVAARRVLEEEDEGAVPALRKHMSAIREERDRLAAEVSAATQRGGPQAEDLEAGVEEALAIMGELEAATGAEDNDLLRAVLGRAVAYVELFFDHAPTGGGKRVRSRYARGLVHVRPQRWAQYIEVNGQPAPCRKTTSG
jgi:site-specific DNA recombinase